MTEQNTAPDLKSAASDNQPDGEGQRPPGANQRADEPATQGGTNDAAADDSTNPATPPLPQSGAHRPSAPSGEVAPS